PVRDRASLRLPPPGPPLAARRLSRAARAPRVLRSLSASTLPRSVRSATSTRADARDGLLSPALRFLAARSGARGRCVAPLPRRRGRRLDPLGLVARALSGRGRLV